MSTSQPPAEFVYLNEIKYHLIREGRASILSPYQEEASTGNSSNSKNNRSKTSDGPIQTVFYNPVQQFNRDLSVLAIHAYGESVLTTKAEKYAKKGDALKRRKERLKATKWAEVDSQPAPAPETSDLQNSDVSKKRKRSADGTGQAEEAGQEAAAQTDDAESNVKRAKVDKPDLEKDDFEDFDLRKKEHTVPSQNAEKATNELNGGSEFNSLAVRFNILDALSATGLRAMRYAKEIPFVTRVIANDLSPRAVKAIELNIDYNNVKGKVCSNVGDARAYMYSKVAIEPDTTGKQIHKFDVIDLDPYGTAAPFFDSALQALQDGGMLAVTCTDAGVFASNGYPEKAYSLYGGIPLKGVNSHEGGLRLILHAIATSAAKYEIAIEPLLSLSIDFYARIFIRIHKKPRDVKALGGTTMLVYNCDYGCAAWTTQLVLKNIAKESKNGDKFLKHSYAQAPVAEPLCEHCGTKTHLSGPMWAGPLHNSHFIQRILNKIPSLDMKVYPTIPRIEGMLTVALEEDLDFNPESPSPSSEVDQASLPIPTPEHTIDSTPFFFHPSQLAKLLHVSTPSEQHLRSAFLNLGYRVTRSHCKPGSFKTDAPWSVIWEIMREWMRRDLKKSAAKAGAAGGQVNGNSGSELKFKVTPGSPGWGVLKNLRGSERAKVTTLTKEMEQGLAKAGTLNEVKTVLEAAFFRLERLQETSQVESSKANDSDAGEKPAPPLTTEQVLGKDPTEAESPTIITGPPSKPPSSPTLAALNSLKINFDDKDITKDKRTVCRYQLNPRPNWGPMNRAGGKK